MRLARLSFGVFLVAMSPLSAIADAPHPAAVQIAVSRPDASIAYGSGTTIAAENGRSLVLTAAHVVDEDYPTTVIAGGKRYAAKRIAGSKVTYVSPTLISIDGPDLALLDVDGELDAAEIAEREPVRGARLRQWGFPGNRQVARSGFAVGYNKTYVGVQVYETSLDVAQGDSGAGLFDDDNRLVAVVWGGAPGAQCCVGTTTIRQFVSVGMGPRFPRLAAQFGRSTTVTTTTIQTMPPVNRPMPPTTPVPAPVPTPTAPKASTPFPTAQPFTQQNCQTGSCAGTTYSMQRRGLLRRW